MSVSDAAAYNITVQFGIGNTRTYNAVPGATIQDVIDDPQNKAALGYPSNVRALINRVEQSLTTQVAPGDRISLETTGTVKQ